MIVDKPTAGIPNFSRLSRAVHLNQPNNNNSVNEPNVILLLGWMNASLRNISKYTAGYERLYASATIIAITTSSVDLFVSKTMSLKRVAPALEILYAIPSDAKILVHSFSNGGALTLSLIAKEFLAQTGRLLPMAAMVLDSAPGKASHQATIRAFGVGLPKFFVLRWFLLALISISYWTMQLMRFVGTFRDLLQVVRDELNSADLFCQEAPRLYIYSKKDYIVRWQEIEEHVAEAKTSGYKVDTETFLDTAHAGHLMGNDSRYWGSVRRLWKASS